MYGRPTRAAPTARWTGASSRSTTSDGERGEHRDGDRQAAERLDDVAPGSTESAAASACGPERVAVLEQRRLVAVGVREPVGAEELLAHVGVEARPEHPEVALDDERDRDADENQDRRRQALANGASPIPGRDRHSTATAASVTTPMTASAVTFSPGSRTVPQATASSSATPTAGDEPRPASPAADDSAACPTTSDAPTTSSAEAYVPSTRPAYRRPGAPGGRVGDAADLAGIPHLDQRPARR